MQRVVFGHKNPDTDSICSAIAFSLGKKEQGGNVTPYRLGDLNKETEFVLERLNVSVPKLLKEVTEDMLVTLVDHNEAAQSVDNIKEAKVVEVYDHHRIANFQTDEPITIMMMPVGCTSTVLFKKFTNEQINITKDMAALMLSAIISDTLLFKSPTCTKLDIEVGKKLAQIAELDLNDYGLQLLKAGTDLKDEPTSKLLDMDTKEFKTSNGKYEVGQINTADIDEVIAQRDSELINLISKRVEEKSLDAFMFIITDIVNSNSIGYIIGPNAQKIAEDFDTEINNHKAFLSGVVSRKKQIVPKL